MLKQLSQKAGLTTTELSIFIFFIAILSAGVIYKYLFKSSHFHVSKFDYTSEDSAFYAAGNIKIAEEKREKVFDYKREVLDFNKRNFNNVKIEKTAAEKSINLNTADLNELISIPGLGEKTAGKIIQYRSEIGNFQTLDQLKNIKGIGEKKFNKIKNYIYIDK